MKAETLAMEFPEMKPDGALFCSSIDNKSTKKL